MITTPLEPQDYTQVLKNCVGLGTTPEAVRDQFESWGLDPFVILTMIAMAAEHAATSPSPNALENLALKCIEAGYMLRLAVETKQILQPN